MGWRVRKGWQHIGEAEEPVPWCWTLPSWRAWESSGEPPVFSPPWKAEETDFWCQRNNGSSSSRVELTEWLEQGSWTCQQNQKTTGKESETFVIGPGHPLSGCHQKVLFIFLWASPLQITCPGKFLTGVLNSVLLSWSRSSQVDNQS